MTLNRESLRKLRGQYRQLNAQAATETSMVDRRYCETRARNLLATLDWRARVAVAARSPALPQNALELRYRRWMDALLTLLHDCTRFEDFDDIAQHLGRVERRRHLAGKLLELQRIFRAYSAIYTARGRSLEREPSVGEILAGTPFSIPEKGLRHAA